ncbi:precorrin-2 C(20)-methyltransferase [Terrabacter sp. MAHUQ-38]|uniref:precorrin-2 C(20)-methyltransferase n=1 Tax=unclassified Terrabacter TaxID=2630222 RepID=UPI00165D45C5|nr:precorrin-2 C(20)-methyltransferase [Terrabacter sp. MAHUQ-38]
MSGWLRGVGVGPGDPELVTVKAARLIGEADVVAFHSGPRGDSIARRIASSYFADGAIEELLVYPVTTGSTDHPLGYHGLMADFYDESADRIAAHLDSGRNVVVLAEGDPLFYGTYMYLHDRLADRYDTAVVPGVTSVSGSAAAVATGLCRHEDVLTILPGTLPVPELARRLADTEAAVVMKLGRTFENVREALRQAGRLEDARYVERASSDAERVLPVSDVDAATVPYMSMVVVPGKDLRADDAGRAASSAATGSSQRDADPAPALVREVVGEVVVVGLGPGPDRWLTPEATAALAEVGHVVGYAPYVNRVPHRAGLTRHASGNTVEVDRARDALELARKGERVAVVSGGDAGVFGMASAVFEAADTHGYGDVPVRVLPGVTAAQAVAARAGAPLGGDFAIMSLSDRLKPWSVIERRLRAAASADLVIALYNPASRSRTEQIARAREVLLEERTTDTVVVVGRDVGRAEDSITVTTLGDLDPASIDMKCLVVVCASGTRVTGHGQVWTPRFVD